MIAGKTIVTVAKPFVEPFVKEFVTSKLQDFAKWCKDQGIKIAVPKSEHFKAYLERMYDKCNVVKTMAISNSQLSLKEIYIPLTLVKNNLNGYESTKINDVPKELIEKYKKILITDTAGMGKSTILKRMFIALIDNVQENLGIPIYIELNKLNKDHLIVDEIRDELKALFGNYYHELVLDFIQTGGFIILLDGYDEISTDKAIVTNDIQTFISKAGANNYYFLTSRPDESLPSFADFQSFSIQPLQRVEAFELLKKYDLDENKELSKSLIATLNSGKYSSIEEYLGNPLLVSLLFTAYNYKQIVPLKKGNFYRQVYVALYEAHKAAQGVKPHPKHSLLEIDDFEKVLRYIGYECLIQNTVRVDEDAILKSIERARNFYGNLKFGPSAFLKDLWTTVPLFVKEGAEYSWAHKSLMEYFAAQFISVDAKEEQDNILSAIFKSRDVSKYGNMLDIYYDIDYKGFSKNITLPLCESYVKFYDSLYIENPKIDNFSIDIRKSLLFLSDYEVEYGRIDTHAPGIATMAFSTNYKTDSNDDIDLWIRFCYRLFLEKRRSSLNIGVDVFNMRRELFDTLEHMVKMAKINAREKMEVNHEEKDINTGIDDGSLMVVDTRSNTYSLYKVSDGQMVFMGSEKNKVMEHVTMRVDLHTGEKHTLLYMAFNISLLHCFQYNYHESLGTLLLDYHACKREIESIRRLLSKNSSNTIPLPS